MMVSSLVCDGKWWALFISFKTITPSWCHVIWIHNIQGRKICDLFVGKETLLRQSGFFINFFYFETVFITSFEHSRFVDCNIINRSIHQEAFLIQAILKRKWNSWKTTCEGGYFYEQLLLIFKSRKGNKPWSSVILRKAAT